MHRSKYMRQLVQVEYTIGVMFTALSIQQKY